MFFFLSAAVKNRFISELRHYWSLHPNYPDLVDNIQGKYAFTERPQYGIVVKSGSASPIQLSADHYMGIVESYVAAARIPGHSGLSIEWVREDSIAIQENGGRFPSPPGVYYCEMTSADEFHVDPLLDVRDERVSMVSNVEGVLQNAPFAESLRLFEMPGARMLRPGVDYNLDPDGVTIRLTTPLLNKMSISADYRYLGESTGPWKVLAQSGSNKAIPGVVMAFGRRYAMGDRWAVLVSDRREPAARLYGGRWELTVDVDVMARDVESQMEIADQTTMYLWSQLRSNLANEGIDVRNVTMGGESEDVYDETGDDYFYNSSISMTVETDWFFMEPVLPRILGYEEQIKSLPQDLSLIPFRDPFFSQGKPTFEMVK